MTGVTGEGDEGVGGEVGMSDNVERKTKAGDSTRATKSAVVLVDNIVPVVVLVVRRKKEQTRPSALVVRIISNYVYDKLNSKIIIKWLICKHSTE
jgi:hypothetical protein